MPDNWYGKPAWRNLRRKQLSEHPLCCICLKTGRETPANTVDHIVPFKKDWGLFVDRNNHQSMCHSCHSRHKQAQEKSGVLVGCDISGVPIDENHHWRKE